jgi:hypothetical protein
MQQQTIANATESLEHMLRLETTAADIYERAVRHTHDGDHANALVELRRDHETAAFDLRNLLASMHDQGDAGTTPLTTLARAVERIASVFGEGATLRALAAGERALGIELKGMLDSRLPPEADRLLRDRLLPATEAHVKRLERMRA